MKSKFRGLMIIGIVFMLFGITACSLTAKPVIYKNPKYYYTFVYPSNWKMVKNSEDMVAVVHPKDNANLGVTVTTTGKYIPSIREMTDELGKYVMSLPEAQQISEQYGTYKDKECVTFEIKFSKDNKVAIQKATWFTDDNNLYGIALTYPENVSQDVLIELSKIFDSVNLP